jgi:hypothetical protein
MQAIKMPDHNDILHGTGQKLNQGQAAIAEEEKACRR